MDQRNDTRPIVSRLSRLAPLLLLTLLAVCLVAGGVPEYFHMDSLRAHDSALRAFVRDHPIEALAMFIAAYVLVTACCLPGVTFLTLSGGYLFGSWIGGAASVIGGATGAVGVYLVVRTSLGPALRDRAQRTGGRLKAAIDGIGARAFSYILTLRLFPLAPFWLVSVAAALAGAPLGAYGLATVIGIIPVTLIYSGIGAGIGRMVAHGGTPGPGLLAQPAVLIPLAALALLSLASAVWLRRRGGSEPHR